MAAHSLVRRQSPSIPIRVVHVVGARPNYMKIAPIMQALAAEEDTFEQFLVHTGQHYDSSMSDVFATELGLPRAAREPRSRVWDCTRARQRR